MVVSAPAGFGKTALLSQWAQEDPRPFAWISLGGPRVEAAGLVRDLALALDAIEPFAPDVRRAFTEPCRAAPDRLVARMSTALGCLRTPFVLVLDNAHLIDGPGTAAILAALVSRPPRASQVAIAGRRDPALPLGRLREEGRLLRLGMRDLALDAVAVGAILRAEGLDLEPDEVAAVAERTEGWPAAVRLAALALKDAAGGSAVADLDGSDHLLNDYLAEEVLAGLPEATVDFLVRASVLPRLSGPLCDAVLERTGSGILLADLDRAGLPLVPLDRRREWLRLHRVLRDMLQGELRRREPERVRNLHLRAADWFHADRDGDAAAAHARAAGDPVRAAGIVWAGVAERVGQGRVGDLEASLAAFRADEVASLPRLALAAAWCAAQTGGELTDHWTAAGAGAARTGAGVGGAALEPDLALLRAAAAADGVERMAADADAASAALEPETSAWRAFASLLQGAARRLLGDPTGARSALEEGARRAGRRLPLVYSSCLGRLALVALDKGRWHAATELAIRARSLVERPELADATWSVMTFPVSALVLARAGRVQDSRCDIRRSERLLGAMVGSADWLAVEARILLARASMLLGDAAAAKALVGAARERLHGAAESPVLRAELDEVHRMTSAASGAPLTRAASLTAAEVRVLRLLPTHLSFRDMGERLHVSRFTIKSQALSVYRKIGATSRAEAVERARVLGLLDESGLHEVESAPP
jgi:LuxR family maltose regulon positive regulatory protein